MYILGYTCKLPGTNHERLSYAGSPMARHNLIRGFCNPLLAVGLGAALAWNTSTGLLTWLIPLTYSTYTCFLKRGCPKP